MIAVRHPLVISQIFVNSDATQGEQAAPGKIWHDQAEVTLLANHWMRPISVALSRPLVTMSVHVGDNSHPFFPAIVPEWNKASSMKNNDTRVQSTWIQIVVTDEFCDSRRAPSREKKSTAFSLAATPPTELPDQADPEPIRDLERIRLHDLVDSDSDAKIPDTG